MPVYEYSCKSCKNKFELMRPFSKSGEGANCPRCQKKADRILSACYSRSGNGSGFSEDMGGSAAPSSGGGCSSCSSGNCGSCGAS
jgi:putative FmdB family regulatory protein